MTILKGTHLLALDYGQKFTGLATYKVGVDPFILSYGRFGYVDDQKLIKDIILLIEQEFIDEIILGIPYYTDGKESKMTRIVKDFAQNLEKSISIPLHLQDEALTTYAAEQRMKNDPKYNFKVDPKKIDSLSAVIILEEFLQIKGLK